MTRWNTSRSKGVELVSIHHAVKKQCRKRSIVFFIDITADVGVELYGYILSVRASRLSLKARSKTTERSRSKLSHFFSQHSSHLLSSCCLGSFNHFSFAMFLPASRCRNGPPSKITTLLGSRSFVRTHSPNTTQVTTGQLEDIMLCGGGGGEGSMMVFGACAAGGMWNIELEPKTV